MAPHAEHAGRKARHGVSIPLAKPEWQEPERKTTPAVVVGTGSGGTGNVETLEFTLDDLAALPQTTIVTENEFSDGKVTYVGPLVRDVLEFKGYVPLVAETGEAAVALAVRAAAPADARRAARPTTRGGSRAR